MKTDSHRNLHVDAVKGFAIILVVLGHVVQMNTPSSEYNLLFRFIYSFHMPLFIFISGYLAYEGMQKKLTLIVIWKRFKSLVIPFLAWHFIYTFLLQRGYQSTSFVQSARDLIKAPDIGLWFLWILFLCFLVTIIFVRIQKLVADRYRAEWSIFLVGAIFTVMQFIHFPYLGYELLRWQLPFYLIGYLVYEYRAYLRTKLSLVREIAFILFPLCLYFWYRGVDPAYLPLLLRITDNYSLIAFINTMFNHIVAFSGIAVVYFAIKALTVSRVQRMLGYLGLFTLDIYVIHYYLFRTVAFGAYGTNDGWQLLAVLVFTTIVATLASLAISQLFLRQSRMLSFLFLGK